MKSLSEYLKHMTLDAEGQPLEVGDSVRYTKSDMKSNYIITSLIGDRIKFQGFLGAYEANQYTKQ